MANFCLTVVDLRVYPISFFSFITSVGLYVVRWRRKKLNLPRPSYRAWDSFIIFKILVDLYLLIMPWYPPEGGKYGGDVSFWYATYIVTGIAV